MTDDLSRSLDRIRWPLRIAYVGILLLATLTNLDPVLDASTAAARAESVFSIHLSPKALVDAARNVALFAGWGLVWMTTARPGKTLRSIGMAFGTGVLISVGVETAQLFSDVRNASPIDVMSNGGGALLGALAVVVAVRWLTRLRGARSFVGMPAWMFAGSYGLAILGEAFMPLLRQDRLNVYGNPLSRFAYVIREFDPASFAVLPLSEIVLYLPAGFFLAAAIAESGHGYRKSAWWAAIGGSLLVALAEIARAAASFEIAGGPLLVHVAALSAGALAAPPLLRRIGRSLRGRERPALLFAIYALVIAFWYLRPYVPQIHPSAWLEQLSGHWWMPMAFAVARLDLFSIIDVTNVFFLFFPLGGLLAVWPFRRHGWWGGILPGLWLAIGVEFAQLFVVGRTLALADILVAAAAVWTGSVLVRRAGFPVRGEITKPARSS
jgi:VanZ family protein